MDEAAIPQNNSDLEAEKGPGCDVRHRFALSSVYRYSGVWRARRGLALLTQNWHFSTIYQAQSGMPLTISVFGDTANSGTVLGENPIRANVTGEPVFGPGTRTADKWFNPAAFAAPPAFTFGNVGRNSVYGPPLQTLDLALARTFRITEKASFQIPGGGVQLAEQGQPGDAEPVREYTAVRDDHDGDDAGAGDAGERAVVVLGGEVGTECSLDCSSSEGMHQATAPRRNPIPQPFARHGKTCSQVNVWNRLHCEADDCSYWTCPRPTELPASTV